MGQLTDQLKTIWRIYLMNNKKGIGLMYVVSMHTINKV